MPAERPAVDASAAIGLAVESSFLDFSSAAHAVLRDLQRRLGLELWVITRAVGEHQVVLEAHGGEAAYGVEAGTVLSWGGSLCRAMVAGAGPHVAPRLSDVPAYATAPNRAHLPVEAYVGVPLLRPDGEVFGTLCAFDPEPQPESLREWEGLVHLQARLLSTILHLELDGERLARRAERAESAATSDGLTGVGNRRGWDDVLVAEEARCRRYGHPACVLVVDLNDLKRVNDRSGHAAGDELLRACADVLVGFARTSDHVARLGGDEFAVLAVETTRDGGEAEAGRLRHAFRSAGISAAVGLGVRGPAGSLGEAWLEADADMYAHKPAR